MAKGADKARSIALLMLGKPKRGMPPGMAGKGEPGMEGESDSENGEGEEDPAEEDELESAMADLRQALDGGDDAAAAMAFRAAMDAA